MSQMGGIHNEGVEEKSGKIMWQRNRQIHSTDQSREPAERAKLWLIGGKEEARFSHVAQYVPNPIPQPWASAQLLCLLQGWPQHRAPSEPVPPPRSRVAGRPLPQSTQPRPGPVRKLQGQELSPPCLALWPSCHPRCPAQLPGPPPGMEGTEEEPKPWPFSQPPPAAPCPVGYLGARCSGLLLGSSCFSGRACCGNSMGLSGSVGLGASQGRAGVSGSWGGWSKGWPGLWAWPW